MHPFDYKKSAQLINYIAVRNGGTVTKLKLFKLVWLANRLHLRRYARTITGDSHVAMEHGPVPSQTKNYLEPIIIINDADIYFAKFLTVNKMIISSNSEPDMKVFSKSDVQVINEVLEIYGNLGAWDLREHSHLFPEWQRYREKFEDEKSKSSFQIVNDDYFSSFDDGSGLFDQDEETLKFMKEDYLENA